jgi:hypothetical protein
MLFDIAITPRQIKALAGWIQDGEHMAEVELAVDDRMLVAEQGDERMAWDTGGEPANESYLAVAPLCEHPDCQRPHARHALGPSSRGVPVPRSVLDDAVNELRARDADSAAAQALADWADRFDGAPISPASPLGDPPVELADAWRRYQLGIHVEGWELSKLDEWRAERAQEAGY